MRSVAKLLLPGSAAALLVSIHLGQALQRAGEYGSRLHVQAVVAFGLFITYFAVLFAFAILITWAVRFRSRSVGWVVTFLAVPLSFGAVVFSPAVPFSVFLLLSAANTSCAEAATFISWAFLATIGPTPPLVSPLWVVAAFVFILRASSVRNVRS